VFEAVVLYVLAVNAAAFAAFALDKRQARRGLHRISERGLLWLAAAGGASGAIAAQQLLRHKTRKEPFRTLLWSIALAQAVGLAAVYVAVRSR
jgi:uncharacterized membrane protein YsdA (DUF1294 family)